MVIFGVLVLIAGCYLAYDRFFVHDNASLEATGTIEATTVELNAKMPGTVKMLSVEAGDRVAKGQLVAELSRNDLNSIQVFYRQGRNH